MAIVKNFWLVNQKKKLAGAVIYQAMGQTRSRELAASVANPRTTSQMNQRVKWANLVNFYRANRGWMKFAYETKKESQSEYNKFMSLNVANSRIYLPKSVAAAGGCIVDSYLMTQGSLPSIEVAAITGGWNTNIFLEDITGLDDNSTIGEVSSQILAQNPAIREGDQLSFLRFTQQTNASTGVPYVVVRKYEVIINSNDIRRFYDFFPADYVIFAGSPQQPALSVQDSGNAGGFLFVLSRTINGKTYVSTQSIVVANNSTLIDAYSSPSALQAAIDSYGESEDAFLTSSSADIDENAPVRASILSVKLGTDTFAVGERFKIDSDPSSKAIQANFSQAMEGSVASVTLLTIKEGTESSLNLSSAVVSGNAVSVNIPAAQSALIDSYVEDIIVSIDGEAYRGVFSVPNSATIGGLE